MATRRAPGGQKASNLDPRGSNFEMGLDLSSPHATPLRRTARRDGLADPGVPGTSPAPTKTEDGSFSTSRAPQRSSQDGTLSPEVPTDGCRHGRRVAFTAPSRLILPHPPPCREAIPSSSTTPQRREHIHIRTMFQAGGPTLIQNYHHASMIPPM